MPVFSTDLLLTSPQATADFAARLGAELRAGDVLLLEGHVGAGKTHFARSLIQSLLAEPEDVPSPTFTLVQSYAAAEFEIWHADLYRLSAPEEIIELGLLDAFEDALCLVEWPDRLAELRPPQALTLRFDMLKQTGQRSLRMQAEAARWQATIETRRDG